ncbi:sensor histidine kinase [Aquisphaera insulae]|uniref:sensor histidine kinase n=1 Tax=Aquisphaera insulae TaxID=2712864 RepID=UPI0013EBD956|nr:HAMP domain-containing sensor histidine kinase [Aquisphaera insulae]
MDVHRDPTRAGTSIPTADPSALDKDELRSLLSSLSHELCRPLVSLRSGFDLLMDDSKFQASPEQRVHLVNMLSLCDDMLRLARGYLDYASLINGARAPSMGTFSLGAIVAEIDRQFRDEARGKGLTWSAVVTSPDASVATDASLCQRIFGNLASNAIKYTPAGGHVEVRGTLRGEDWLVSVSDDGPGIPEDSLIRVFDPFYRLARDEHSRIEGNGLGLTICRELTERLGGRIEISSFEGEGTTVRASFPISAPTTACVAVK